MREQTWERGRVVWAPAVAATPCLEAEQGVGREAEGGVQRGRGCWLKKAQGCPVGAISSSACRQAGDMGSGRARHGRAAGRKANRHPPPPSKPRRVQAPPPPSQPACPWPPPPPPGPLLTQVHHIFAFWVDLHQHLVLAHELQTQTWTVYGRHRRRVSRGGGGGGHAGGWPP